MKKEKNKANLQKITKEDFLDKIFDKLNEEGMHNRQTLVIAKNAIKNIVLNEDNLYVEDIIYELYKHIFRIESAIYIISNNYERSQKFSN